MTSLPRSAGLSDDGVAESRRRQSKRDEAIRRKIELDLSKRKRDTSGYRRLRHGQPGTVLLLRPSPPIVCAPSTSAYQAAQLMLAKRENCVLVVDSTDSLVGIFTAKDLAFRVVGSNVAALLATVDLIMTPNPVCAHANDPASEALRLMVERGFRHLPVLDSDSRMVGVLDITKCYAAQMEKLERLHASARQLNDALESVLEEMGAAGLHPAHVFRYFEDLRAKMNGPTLLLVLNDKTVPVYTNVKANVYDATVLMKQHGTTVVLVKDLQGLVAGIFTSKDVVLRVIAAGIDPKNCSIVRVMTPQPDVVLLLLPIQQALRQMLERHYLNLPVVDDHQTIIGMVEVLNLTHATLRQIEQAETDIGTPGEGHPDKAMLQLGEGPAWNKFWSSLDDGNALDSIHSTSISGLERARSIVQRNVPEVSPSDSISHTGIESEKRAPAYPSSSSTVQASDRSFTFKFKSVSGSGRAHRVALHPQEGLVALYRLIEPKLSPKEYGVLGVLPPQNRLSNFNDHTLPDDTFAISYLDEDGDYVAITSDNCLRECIETFRAANINKANLVLHHPEQCPLALHKPPMLSDRPGLELTSNLLVHGMPNIVLATGVVATIAALSVLFAKSLRKP